MTTEAKTFQGIRHLADNVPIANPSDHDWTRNVYLFRFGAYGGTSLYVFADSVEDAFEIAVEWLDDYAPGCLHTVTEEDYREAATGLGIDYDGMVQGDLGEWRSDRDYERIAERAEADCTMIGHTTLQNGNCVLSYEWTVDDADFAAVSHSAELDSFPSVADILPILREIRAEIDSENELDEEGNVSRDVRLQCHAGDWQIHDGDPCYDQDHRGYWGRSSVSPDDSDDALQHVAEDLIDQCEEDHAQNVPECAA